MIGSRIHPAANHLTQQFRGMLYSMFPAHRVGHDNVPRGLTGDGAMLMGRGDDA